MKSNVYATGTSPSGGTSFGSRWFCLEGDTNLESDQLKQVLEQLSAGVRTVDSVLSMLAEADEGMANTADACVDLDRQRRCGFPEVVYGPGKTSEAIVAIFEQIALAGQPCFATRISIAQADAVEARFPDAIYNHLAGTIRLAAPRVDEPRGRVFVISAGTSDRPVAEEALETLRWMNCGVEFIQDVGVAGPQRLLRQVERMRAADVCVVVAGMEGALASVSPGMWTARSSRFRPASVTEPTLRVWRPCCRCSIVVRRTSRS